ncbi:hypothetical protein CR513_43573, partial [Mucuna pruriens]
MARFLNGLNREIQDIFELHDYSSLSILAYQASRNVRRTYPSISFGWKGKERREDKSPKRDKSPKKGSVPLQGRKEEISISTPYTSIYSKIKCFKCLASQCPNKRTMILKENGEMEKEISQEETSTSESDYSSEEAFYEGDLLMCLIKGKFCSLIIDGGSSVNVARLRLVENLSIPTLYHPKPCKVQWLSNNGKWLLIRRPWQYDRKMTHDVVTNKFSFVNMGHKVTLKSCLLKKNEERKENERKLREKKGEKNEEKKKKKNKSESLLVSKKKILLKEPLFLLPTNIFSKEIPLGLLPQEGLNTK